MPVSAPRCPPLTEALGAAKHPVARDIVVTFDEEAVATDGIVSLATCPEVFTHVGHLVSLVSCSTPGTSIDRRHAQAARADDPTWPRRFLPNANTDGTGDRHGDALRVECVHEAPLDAEVGSTSEHADRQTAAQRSEVLADDDLGA